MTAADIPATMETDKAAFDKAWSEKFFSDELRKDYAYYFVAESGEGVIGYVGIWCIYETAELIRIAVMPDCQRCGVADSLMKEILCCAKGCACERMMLEVKDSNIAARELYKKHSFNEISVRRGYYDGEDAIIMEAEIKQDE